ncbi:hypothetical protein, partial [Oerskovia jenensis]|uniref:hypothetical protein n=1 Tax=Oerskovia jenensis TaxID=162169 RepID=UPI003CD06FC5
MSAPAAALPFEAGAAGSAGASASGAVFAGEVGSSLGTEGWLVGALVGAPDGDVESDGSGLAPALGGGSDERGSPSGRDHVLGCLDG